MLISCEKCSTTYVLDETLIPAAGAAVQCTRCSHVFTAFPPKPDTQATVLEEEPTTTKRRTPAAAGIPQGGRPANQTMVFGTGAAPPAAPQPPAGRPANQTMMFGGGAPAPASQPPAPQPRAANQTMVFGTPAGQQAAQQPAPSQAPNPNQTLVFGASPVAPPAAAANPHQTLVFGTAAGQQAAAREPAPHANAPANQTLVFGNSPVAPPAGNANQTLVFGTPAGQAASQPVGAAAGPAANQTLVFGASPVAPPTARSTQMFGAAQAPAPAPQAAPPRPAATTVMFGAGQVPPPAAPAANKAPNTTMMFGKPPEAVAAAATRTMAFGTPVVTAPKKPQPLPQVTQGNVELSGDVEPEQRSESTVRVDLERMMREQGEGGEESQESVEQRHDRTQRFAMTDSSATNPGESAESVQDRHNRTALFAMSTLQETTKPDAKVSGANTAPDLHGVAEPTVGFDQPLDAAQTIPPGNTTLPHGSMNFGLGDDPPGVSTLLEPGGEDMRATVRHDGPIASTMPNLPPISHEATDAAHRAPLRLDIVSSPGLPMVAPDALQSTDVQGDGGVEALAAQGRRRNIVAIVIVLLLVLAVALGVFWQFFGKQLLTKDLDPRLVQASEQALTQFRKEDSQLRDTEIERLTAIVKENPSFVDGHAALVLGLGLECDDLYGERAFVDYRYTAFKKQMEAVKDDAKKIEFGKRANEMVARSEALAKPTETAVAKLDASMKAMDAALRSGAAASQSARARAFGFALRAGQATSVEEGGDYWARLASALAVLYAPKSTPEAIKAALGDVQKLSAEDDQLARPHFVAARLHLALGDEEKAIASLEKAIKVAPKFTAAADSRKLLDLK